jgi:hypothetical protein
MKINFQRCTGTSLIQMYRHYFDTKELPPSVDTSHLPELRWTPAEATQIFLNNMYDPPQALEDLIRLEPTALFAGHVTDSDTARARPATDVTLANM